MTENTNTISNEISQLESKLKELKLKQYTDVLPPVRNKRSNLSAEERIEYQRTRARAYYYKNREKILALQKEKRMADKNNQSKKDDEIAAGVTLVL